MSRWSKYEEGGTSVYVPPNVGLTLPSRRAQDAAGVDPTHMALCEEWEAFQAELQSLRGEMCRLDEEMYHLQIASSTFEWNDPLKAPIAARAASTQEEMWAMGERVSHLVKVGEVIKVRLAVRMSELDLE